MLTDSGIDKLIQPIIERQQEINSWAIRKIVQHIKEIGAVLPSDVERLIQMRNAGADAKELVKQLATMAALQAEEIKNLVRSIAINAYEEAKPFYDFRKKSYIPYKKNTVLKRRIEAMANRTAGSYLNLSKAQAFMIRDPKNPTKLIATPVAKTYQSVVDEAVQSVSTNVSDYQSAMRRTINQLVESGIRYVEYNPESGRTYTQRLDTAVRRNLLDGIRGINQEMQNLVGKEFGADGVEISVHMYPAPDHAEMQGHQYTLEEFDKMQNGEDFEDIQGRGYIGFERAVGTLNCRHFAISIVIGAKPLYTDEQLKEILAANEKGYTLSNGKHLTMYECTQKQRQMETEIRKAKDGQMAAKAAGDMELAKKYQAKINQKTREYKSFSGACGLSVKKTKMSVSGYRPIKLS